MDALIAIAVIVGVVILVGLTPTLIVITEEAAYRLRSRRRRKSDLELERLARHQRTLKRIDELERELEIGKYSPQSKELDRRLKIDAGLELVRVGHFGGQRQALTAERWSELFDTYGDQSPTVICAISGRPITSQQYEARSADHPEWDDDTRWALAVGLMCQYGRNRDAVAFDREWKGQDVDDGEWAEIPADDVDTDIIQAFGMGMVRKTYRR